MGFSAAIRAGKSSAIAITSDSKNTNTDAGQSSGFRRLASEAALIAPGTDVTNRPQINYYDYLLGSPGKLGPVQVVQAGAEQYHDFDSSVAGYKSISRVMPAASIGWFAGDLCVELDLMPLAQPPAAQECLINQGASGTRFFQLFRLANGNVVFTIWTDPAHERTAIAFTLTAAQMAGILAAGTRGAEGLAASQ